MGFSLQKRVMVHPGEPVLPQLLLLPLLDVLVELPHLLLLAPLHLLLRYRVPHLYNIMVTGVLTLISNVRVARSLTSVLIGAR